MLLIAYHQHRMVMCLEWYLNTIQDTLPYDADDMLSIAYPIILASNSILPPFKYLSKAKHKYPEIEAKATYTCINDLLNTTIKKERNKDKYIGMTFSDLTQNYDDLKILGKIPYLADAEIESIDLKTLLLLFRILLHYFHLFALLCFLTFHL